MAAVQGQIDHLNLIVFEERTLCSKGGRKAITNSPGVCLYLAVQPPSTTIMLPVVKLLAGLAR
jgi:hypothetical protein